MAYLPPVGQVILSGVTGYQVPPGDAVLLKPSDDPLFRDYRVIAGWSQAGATLGESGVSGQWAQRAPVFTNGSSHQGWRLRAFEFQEMAASLLWQAPRIQWDDTKLTQRWSTAAARFQRLPADQASALLAALFQEQTLAQCWAVSPFTYRDLPLQQQWRQRNLIISEGRFHAQWLLEATAVWTPVISATVYRFALENPQDRAEMPISNFSGQLRSGEPSYLQVTIPDARAWADVIADFALHSETDIVIQAGYRWSDGRFETQEIARTRLRNVRYDLGARSSSVLLDGIDTRINPTPKTVSLMGASYRSQDEAGRVRYRCAMNFDIRPGDTASIHGETFLVGELSYNVTVNNATLEVAEALI